MTETYSWKAYQGLLLLDEASDDSLSAADESGLIEQHAHGGRRWWMRTDQGIRCRARLQELAEELVTEEDARLMSHALSFGRNHFSADSGTPDNGAWSRLVMVGLAKRAATTLYGPHTSTTCGPHTSRSLYMVLPLGRAVLWVREHGGST